MTGQRYGRLLVLKQDFNTNTNHKAYWFCKCDCGKIVSIRGQDLRQGKTTSCGCYAKEKASCNTTPDMTGQKFGKLTVIKRIGSRSKHSLWLCKCDCGKFCEVIRDSLISGNTKSCGCILSNGENIIANILTKHNIKYKQQYTFPDLIGKYGSKLRFDFGIFDQDNQLICLLEFQGEQHYVPFKYDTPETFQLRQFYDSMKRDYCKIHNIPLIEISYKDRNRITWEYLQQLLPMEHIVHKANQNAGFDWSEE